LPLTHEPRISSARRGDVISSCHLRLSYVVSDEIYKREPIVRGESLWMSGISFGKTFRNRFLSDSRLLISDHVGFKPNPHCAAHSRK
jgi:hypothetical protein